MIDDKEKLKQVKKALEQMQQDLGWHHWPRNSSTKNAVMDKLRKIIAMIP